MGSQWHGFYTLFFLRAHFMGAATSSAAAGFLTLSDPEDFSLKVGFTQCVPDSSDDQEIWDDLDALLFFYSEDPCDSASFSSSSPSSSRAAAHQLLLDFLQRREADGDAAAAQASASGRLYHLQEGGKLYLFYHTRIGWLLQQKKPLYAEQCLIGEALRQLRERGCSKLFVDASALREKAEREALWQFLYSLQVAAYRLPHYKTQNPPSLSLPTSLHVLPPQGMSRSLCRQQFDTAASFARGSNWIRHMMVEPANVLTPRSFCDVVQKRSQKLGLKVKFFSLEELRERGAHAFCAVAGAHPQSGAGILEVVYEPSAQDHDQGPCFEHLAFVGKGITYDSGGVNVKPARYMRGMKNDMTGASMAFAMVQLAQEQRWPGRVSAYLAVADNLISTSSYKPDDVVRSYSGITIEVVHTDAEGRMILADTLALAAESRPQILIDFATLTGSSVAAISRRYHSVYTNRPQWYQTLIDSGLKSGERVWPFPLDEDFGEGLKSSVADTLQCYPDGGVDHIGAALFLQKFIPAGLPWLHMDLSNARTPPKPLGSSLTVETGFGPRFVVEFLMRVSSLESTTPA